MSEIETRYSIACPECWNAEEGNQATLFVVKDWIGKKYIFMRAEWECPHCEGRGTLTREAVKALPNFNEVDLGET